MKTRIGLILCCWIVLLSACQRPTPTENYLLEHPSLLIQEFYNCDKQNKPNKLPAPYCVIIFNTVSKLNHYLAMYRDNQVKFGMQILTLEQSCVQLQTQIATIQQTIAKLKRESTTQAELQIAEHKLAELEMTYEQQRREVKIMLGVIGMHSPQ